LNFNQPKGILNEQFNIKFPRKEQARAEFVLRRLDVHAANTAGRQPVAGGCAMTFLIYAVACVCIIALAASSPSHH